MGESISTTTTTQYGKFDHIYLETYNIKYNFMKVVGEVSSVVEYVGELSCR